MRGWTGRAARDSNVAGEDPEPVAEGETTHRVLIVEDDAPTRARLEEAIRGHPRLELAGSAGSLAEARAALRSLQPEVLLTDLGLPDGDGSELIREAGAEGRQVLAMVITVFGDERHVVRALQAGALGYLLKDGDADQIGRSILEMLAGGSPISPPIARYVLRRLRRPGASEDAPKLSERELEVLSYVVKGFGHPEIAQLMGVSPHTVATHVRSIYRKLAVHSRGEAVYEALQMGIVRLDD
jgi:DNA-binding NarL/FixJ family response regulator